MTNLSQPDGPARIYDYVRDNILNQVYKPGQPLRAQEIAEAMGVSRTPVREALGQLEQYGLVEKTGWGFVVRAMTLQDIENLFDVREVLEVEAARKAMLHAEQPWLDELVTILAESKRHLDDGRLIDSIRTARRLYIAIAMQAKNPVLLRMIRSINEQVQLVGGTLILRFPGRATEIYAENLKIVDAFRAGDMRRLDSAIRSHIRRSRKLHLLNKDQIRAG
ncbi:GntR family transcriptional regulator [Pollutimonas bauzanensis]|jgi:DNA-binding GntR family transcriptional regulator|uniref:GntR family transcriptional regulator n=1 Tax=Pollutimonas bauzanensis TaxID=658167 RepID=UPI003340B926